MYKIEDWSNLGEQYLKSTLKNAHYALTKKSEPSERWKKHFQESSNALIFIQNSGIHKIVETFGLIYNPDTLQNQFFYYVHIA